jgi:hypothetical protein
MARGSLFSKAANSHDEAEPKIESELGDGALVSKTCNQLGMTDSKAIVGSIATDTAFLAVARYRSNSILATR